MQQVITLMWLIKNVTTLKDHDADYAVRRVSTSAALALAVDGWVAI